MPPPAARNIRARHSSDSPWECRAFSRHGPGCGPVSATEAEKCFAVAGRSHQNRLDGFADPSHVEASDARARDRNRQTPPGEPNPMTPSTLPGDRRPAVPAAAARFPIFVLAFSALFSLFAVPRAEPIPDEFMPVSEIRPGMKGEGRTVFQGYEIETFDVEILGVEHNWFAGGDLILARASGRLLENHGIVAGMSGSPVYIDGKLIGAVAYGWTYAYKPYCGITPIEQMWTVFENIGRLPRPAQRREAGGRASVGREGWNWQAGWERYRAVFEGRAEPEESGLGGRGRRPTLPALANEEGELRPLATPIMISGASIQTERLLRRFFAMRGMEVLGAGTLAGSAGAGREPAPPIQAGSALGVPMLQGDLSVAGVGTVTWRRDDRLIAFGHPMNSEGSVDAPFAPAYTFGVMQSYSRSFKLSEVGEPVGTIDQDRIYAIGARLGATPSRVPISVRVGGPAAAIPRTYSFSAWEDRDLLPSLIVSAALESFVTSVSEAGKLTADTRYSILLGDGRRFERTIRASSEGLVVTDGLVTLLRDLYLLLQNPFAEADIAGIDVSIDVRAGYREEALLAVRTDRRDFTAGETVRMTATIRSWHADDYERAFEIALPPDLEPGVYVLHIVDTDGAERMDRLMTPGVYQPRGFEDVIELVRRPEQPSDRIRVALLEPALDLDLRGDVLRRLPSSIGAVIESTADPLEMNAAVGRLVTQTSFEARGPIYGSQTALIRVVDHFDE
jgi:hypothetical protein